MLSFSQTTSTTFPKITKDSLIVLTPLQLKKTNLIFVEHSQMKEQISLLKKSIEIKDSLLYLSENYKNNQLKQIKLLEKEGYEKTSLIEDLNASLKKQTKRNKRYKAWAIGGCSVSIGLITLILLTK